VETFLVMVPLTIVLIGVSIWIFSWAVKSGQYDDLEGPAHSILYDDDEHLIPGIKKNKGPQQLDDQDRDDPSKH
jgi:cbb3-type cytochrome oxidase maturation protein